MRRLLPVVIIVFALIAPNSHIAAQQTSNQWSSVGRWRIDYAYAKHRSNLTPDSCDVVNIRSETLTGSGVLKRVAYDNPSYLVWKDVHAVQSGNVQERNVNACPSDAQRCDNRNTGTGSGSGTIPSVIRLHIEPHRRQYHVKITIRRNFWATIVIKSRSRQYNAAGACETYTVRNKKAIRGGEDIDLYGPLPASGLSISGTARLDESSDLFFPSSAFGGSALHLQHIKKDPHVVLHWRITPAP